MGHIPFSLVILLLCQYSVRNIQALPHYGPFLQYRSMSLPVPPSDHPSTCSKRQWHHVHRGGHHSLLQHVRLPERDAPRPYERWLTPFRKNTSSHRFGGVVACSRRFDKMKKRIVVNTK